MSQYTLNGRPVPLGSIQYSPFFCALVNFQMSLQETPGNSGDEPFLTYRREETWRTDMKPFPRKKNSFLGNLRSLRNKTCAVKTCETNTYFQVIYLTLHIKHLSFVINGPFCFVSFP